MKLAPNEQVIGDWEYAGIKKRRKKTASSLILTNRRLIHDTASKRTIERHELTLNQVDSIDYYHRKFSNFVAILLIVLGALFAAGGIVGFVLANLLPIMLVGIVVGLVFILIGIWLLNRCDFTLVVYTKGLLTQGLRANNGIYHLSQNSSISSPKKRAGGVVAAVTFLLIFAAILFALTMLVDELPEDIASKLDKAMEYVMYGVYGLGGLAGLVIIIAIFSAVAANSNKGPAMKLRVSRECVEEIIDSLGAAVIDCQQQVPAK